MSIFNEANDLASQLVYGRYYQSSEPCPKPDRMVFVNGDSTVIVTTTEESHEERADVASAIHNLFNHGYRLGCDMDVSWNGRYDTDGDPLPGGPGNYLPCRKQVSVSLNGRRLCDEHDYPDCKAKSMEAQQGSASAEEL